MKIDLPMVEALAPHQSFASGANLPLVVTAVREDSGQRDEYVVKLKAGHRMTKPDAHMREAVCSFMAQCIGLPTPQPVQVRITTAFANGVRGNADFSRIQASVGLNFGTCLLTGVQVPLLLSPLNAHQKKDAALMLVFDTLIENPDRRRDKPNMLTDGRRLYAIDHELAGGFLPILGRAPGGQLSANDQRQLANHFLSAKLNGATFDFFELAKRLRNMNGTFWQDAWNTLPAEWRHEEQFDRMRKRIEDTLPHAETFIQHIAQQLP